MAVKRLTGRNPGNRKLVRRIDAEIQLHLVEHELCEHDGRLLVVGVVLQQRHAPGWEAHGEEASGERRE
jgi:hypothetical protein